MSKPWWEMTFVHAKRGHEMRVMNADGAGDPLRERHVALVYTPSRHDDDGIETWDDADRAADAMARGLSAAPYMARALIRVAKLPCPAVTRYGRPCRETTPGDDCAVCQAQAALIKAGVPLE